MWQNGFVNTTLPSFIYMYTCSSKLCELVPSTLKHPLGSGLPACSAESHLHCVLCAEMHKLGRIVGHGGAKKVLGQKDTFAPVVQQYRGKFPTALWVRRLWSHKTNFNYKTSTVSATTHLR